jgi:hypothetical protein
LRCPIFQEKAKRGKATFLIEYGIRPYPKEAREVNGIKAAFFDDKA